MKVTRANRGWLLLLFRLPAKRASQRVELWRRLRRLGALPLAGSGYVLPDSPQHHEQFQWLAASVSKNGGEATVAQVRSFGDSADRQLAARFRAAPEAEYQKILREAGALAHKPATASPARLTRLRRRLQAAAERDFFSSPLRARAERQIVTLQAKFERPQPQRAARAVRVADYRGRVWVTRPRPGIDRVASAWLIRRFIDPRARFAFSADPRSRKNAVPFDTFAPYGFGHRGDDCTFETLVQDFGIRDARVAALAEMVHDADLGDEKFGRTQALGIEPVLRGWSRQGLSDQEVLRRGIQLIEGLYLSA